MDGSTHSNLVRGKIRHHVNRVALTFGELGAIPVTSQGPKKSEVERCHFMCWNAALDSRAALGYRCSKTSSVGAQVWHKTQLLLRGSGS